MSWMEKLKDAASQAKDAGAALGIRHWLERELAEFGQVEAFSLDSRAKTAELRLRLRGENESLTVTVEDYSLQSGSHGDYVVVRRARASRAWVEAVLGKFILDKPLQIPEKYSAVARGILG